jgi:hypothetical protein
MTGQPYDRSRDQPSIYDGDARPAITTLEQLKAWEAGVEAVRKALARQEPERKHK